MLRKILISVLLLGAITTAEEKRVGVISCEPQLIYRCVLEKCEKIEVININDPQYFEIDMVKKTLAGKIGEAQVDIENIVNELGDEKAYVFYGLKKDTSSNWIMRIMKKSGNMSIAVVNGAGEGFTIFGKCNVGGKK